MYEEVHVYVHVHVHTITQYGSTVYIYGLPCIIAIHFSFNLNLSSKDIKVENM